MPQTGNGDWNTYQVVKARGARHLDAGEQILRVSITGAQCNIDKMELKLNVSDGIEQVETQQPQAGAETLYNLAGQRVGSDYRGIVIMNGKKLLKK